MVLCPSHCRSPQDESGAFAGVASYWQCQCAQIFVVLCWRQSPRDPHLLTGSFGACAVRFRTGGLVTTYGPDIYTEPEGDPDTLGNLGPLRPLAGAWEGAKGSDQHPVVEGAEQNAFIEHYELQPIDRQTNGPQLFYGLRYHTHITKPGDIETFHDQVGYWLWEPATESVTLTLASQGLRCSWHRDPQHQMPLTSSSRRHWDQRSTASCPIRSSTRPSGR